MQALQIRLPPGAPPAEHDTAPFREWREGVQVSGLLRLKVLYQLSRQVLKCGSWP